MLARARSDNEIVEIIQQSAIIAVVFLFLGLRRTHSIIAKLLECKVSLRVHIQWPYILTWK